MGQTPKLHESVVVFSNTAIIGDVEIDEESSIWFGTVLRGDVNYIRIGKRTNIQDNSVVHVTTGGSPTIIGDDVTVGHSAVIHACNIKNRSLIGMGAIIMDDVTIGSDSIVAAGSVVPPGKSFPDGSLIKGSPAKVARPLTEDEIVGLQRSATHYVALSKKY